MSQLHSQSPQHGRGCKNLQFANCSVIRLTWLGPVLLHNQTDALKQPLQAVYSLSQSLPVLHRGQIRLAVPLHCRAVADNEVAAIQRADVDSGCVALTQAGHQLHSAADAATVDQDANSCG